MIKALQVVQNKVARSVCKIDKFTSTKDLMKACSLISVRQMICYHSVVKLNKTLDQKTPENSYQKAIKVGYSPTTPVRLQVAAGGDFGPCQAGLVPRSIICSSCLGISGIRLICACHFCGNTCYNSLQK